MNSLKIAILGLGYVGLPLAIAFSKKFKTIGYDISKKRVFQLKQNIDQTLELKKQKLKNNTNLIFTNDIKDLINQDIYIVAVPTPIDNKKQPDLKPLVKACEIVASVIKKKNFVIFESTVYPGLTEEICIPIIEKISNLKINEDFFAGYSPERINPGDNKHTISNITKVTSGSNEFASKFVDKLYSKIITVGTFRASSIKVAEAAKIIENTQRDINIALMNELSQIFYKLNIDTKEVLDAAGTKWNFHKFTPGLVGGHCIGVDPYYLTFKSNQLKHKSKIILAGRKINDSMHNFLYKILKKKLDKNKINKKKIKALILGVTFKENCPDIRNARSINLIKLLEKKNFYVQAHDPYAKLFAHKKLNFKLTSKIKKNFFDVIIILTPHKYYCDLGIKKIKLFGKKNAIIFDVKSIFPKSETDLRI